MNTVYKPNIKLFIAFLIINSAGYKYENNPAGQHPLRSKMVAEFFNIIKQEPKQIRLLSQIKDLPCSSNEYIRLINLLFKTQDNDPFFDSKNIKVIKNIFITNIKELEKSTAIKNLYKQYCSDIKNYTDLRKYCKKELERVIKFFNLKSSAINLIIQTHLNLLDSFQRGTNYNNGKTKIISFSLNFDNNINWQTVRHEFMHLLLKNKYHNDLTKSNIVLPVGKGYLQDSVRVKFEENFIYAANLFFIPEQKKRDSNLKYFFDSGYTRIYEFYNLIDDYFIKHKYALSSSTLNNFVKELNNK